MPRNQRPKRKGAPPAAPKPPKPAQTEFERWQGDLSERERHVHEIFSMMCNGQWIIGGHLELAKQWGYTPDSVKQIASEANRLLRFVLRESPEERKDALASILMNFEVIRILAMKDKTPQGLAVALAANKALADYSGLQPARRIAVEDEPSTEPWDREGWSDKELAEYSRTGKRPRQAVNALVRARREIIATAEAIDGESGDGSDDIH